MKFEVVSQAVFQWLALVIAGILLGDTWPHAIGIMLAIYAVMPVARD